MRQAAFPGLIARGRDAELAIVGSQLDRVRSGVGAVLLMEAGAGMGKSRLLEEGARIAGRMSFRVGSGAPTVASRARGWVGQVRALRSEARSRPEFGVSWPPKSGR
jgi:hypothetical protein